MRFLFVLIPALLLGMACSDDSPTDNDPPPPPPQDNTFSVPAEHPTIAEAIAAASSGDTVLVADGTYTGDGNRDLDLGGKSLIIVSENGPLTTTLDLAGDSANPHLGFLMNSGEDNAVIDGFTIIRGYNNNGGAINIQSCDPTIRNCVFVDNTAPVSGGAIWCKAGSPTIENCTFVGNHGQVGSALFTNTGGTAQVSNCLIAYGTGELAVYVNRADAVPELRCTNMFSNEDGSWVEDLEGADTLFNNLAVDPLFCDSAGADYRLQPASPCAPANNACNNLIGALKTGCQ
ncbi:hypothetical protein GF420_08845 [candidate division GN15 bacterium]|nr:hypothetical protein [candidate division GN15 bacterium]